MTITVEQVQRGVTSFVEEEIGRKSTGIMKFAVYFILPSIPEQVKNKLLEFMDKPGFSCFFDGAGNINLDPLYQRAKETMDKVGKLELPQYHITLETMDIDKLYEYIKKA